MDKQVRLIQIKTNAHGQIQTNPDESRQLRVSTIKDTSDYRRP